MSSKTCKYGCSQQLTWDTNINKFVEADGTEHSKERCAYMKSLQKLVASTAPSNNSNFDQRQADIQKAHEENIKASEAQTEAIRAQTNELAKFSANVARLLAERAERDNELIQLLKATLKALPIWNTADKLPPTADMPQATVRIEEQ